MFPAVGSLVKPIGKKKRPHAGGKFHAESIKGGKFTGQKSDPGTIRIEGTQMVAYEKHQFRMARPGIFKGKIHPVEDTAGKSHISFIPCGIVKTFVQAGKKIFERGEVLGICPDITSCHSHYHTCRDPFAAGIADNDHKTVVIQFHKIVKVSADLFGGTGERMNGKPPPDGDTSRKEGLLKHSGKVQFLGKSLLFRKMGIGIKHILGKKCLCGNEFESCDLIGGKIISLIFRGIDGADHPHHFPLIDQRYCHKAIYRNDRLIT